MIKSILFLLLFLVNLGAGAANPWFEASNSPITVNAYAFLSSTCSYCHEMEKFLTQFSETHPWLKVKKYYINQDIASLSLFHSFLLKDNSFDYYVPSLYFCDSRWVGFIPDQKEALTEGLLYCAKQLNHEQRVTPTMRNTLQQMANAYLSHFQLIVLDGHKFSPVRNLFLEININLITTICLLALLLLLGKSSWRFFMSICFLSVISLVHYFHQSYLISFWQYLNNARPLSSGLGFILLLSLWFKKDLSLLIVGIFIAALLQAYLQTTIPNPALNFQQWLMEQSTHPLLYNLIYHMAYAFVIGTLAWLAYYLMRKRKNNYCEVFANSCLSFIGIILILYPWFFAKTRYMSFVLFGLILISYLYIFIRSRYGKQKTARH